MRTLVLGAGGMVGSALMRRIPGAVGVTRQMCDLRDPSQVEHLFSKNRFDKVYMAAAKVGGIDANRSQPVDFLHDNILIQCNVMKSAHRHDVSRLLFLGSSCIYPKMASQPLNPNHLMSGKLEKTNSAYAMAKLSGIELVNSYRQQYGRKWFSVLPTNLYGPGDNYDLKTSHVAAALIRKISEAHQQQEEYVEIWGTGTPNREFMHVDDMADACVFLMESDYDSSLPVNIGTGMDISITNLAKLIAEIIGYKGSFMYNTSMPDGVKRKLLDVSVLREMGWIHNIPLAKGLEQTITLHYGKG
jgi:GDP-L-fucose synthase